MLWHFFNFSGSPWAVKRPLLKSLRQAKQKFQIIKFQQQRKENNDPVVSCFNSEQKFDSFPK